ncbi:hypothetical protein DYB26_015739, partial [Aphanomyces astaci]
MSRFLKEPQTDKTSEAHVEASLGLTIGASSMQGWRESMEDAELVDTKLPGLANVALLAIFDGHGGDFIAKETAKQIVDQIVSTDDYNAYDGTNPYALVSALSEAFLRTDDALREAHTDGTADEVGATGLVVLVTKYHIISANVGDSRCILSDKSGHVPIQMSLDHKPDHEAEKLRILAAGGTVFRGR